MASSITPKEAVNIESEEQTVVSPAADRYGVRAKITTVLWLEESDESYSQVQRCEPLSKYGTGAFGKSGKVKIEVFGTSWSVAHLADDLERLVRKLRR